MDNLIFSFDKKQLNKYLELKNTNQIPDLSPFLENVFLPEWERTDFDELINIISHLTENTLFSKSLNKDEWKNKLTDFYSATDKLNNYIFSLNKYKLLLIEKLKEFETIQLSLTRKYNAFLPCLAAFGNSNDVKKTDACLKASLSEIENKSLELSNYILSLNIITDTIIPEFFKNAEKIITDRENFSQKNLNFACNSAIERIKTTISK